MFFCACERTGARPADAPRGRAGAEERRPRHARRGRSGRLCSALLPARVGVCARRPVRRTCAGCVRRSPVCQLLPDGFGLREWTTTGRGRRAAVHGLGDSLWFASCRKYLFWDTCHAMHADGCPTHGTGGWAACLLRLHCSIPPPIQSLLPARGPGRALPAIFAWSTQKAHTTREERGPGKRYPPRAVLAGGSPRRLRERPDIVT
jgi:hypothetical protein